MNRGLYLLLFGQYRKNILPLFLRFIIYLVATVGLWIFPPYGLVGSFILVFSVGVLNGVHWFRYFLSLSWGWIIVIFPFLSAAIANISMGLPILSQVEESVVRSLTLLAIFCASHWYSGTLTIVEVQKMTMTLFRPFGFKIQRNLSLLITLSLSFIPQIFAEYEAMNDAAKLRLGGRTNNVRRFAIIGVPLLSRLIIRAYRTAEALTIRSVVSKN